MNGGKCLMPYGIMAKKPKMFGQEFAYVQSLTMTILYSWFVVYEFMPLKKLALKKKPNI